MVQKVLPLRSYKSTPAPTIDEVGAVGLKCEDSVVTLRFMPEGATWGQPAKQIKLDRKLAEQLSRILADELEDYS